MLGGALQMYREDKLLINFYKEMLESFYKDEVNVYDLKQFQFYRPELVDRESLVSTKKDVQETKF